MELQQELSEQSSAETTVPAELTEASGDTVVSGKQWCAWEERNCKEAESAVAVVLRFFEVMDSLEEVSSIGTIVRAHRLYSLIFLSSS